MSTGINTKHRQSNSITEVTLADMDVSNNIFLFIYSSGHLRAIFVQKDRDNKLLQISKHYYH